MRTTRNFLGIASAVCVLALLTVPASAFSQPDEAGRGEKITGHLDRLEEQGYDVSEIRAAVENGEQERAKKLMEELVEKHREEFGIPQRDD